MRVLITGGEGFIGRHLRHFLQDRGDEVLVAGRPRTTSHEGMDTGVLRVDLSDRNAVNAVFAHERFDVVFHLAARTRRESKEDLSHWVGGAEEDLVSLLTVVSAAAASHAPPRAFVRTGSIAEYGHIPLPYREDSREYPTTAYGTALLAGSRYLDAMQPSLPFPVANARLALTYGPGQSPSFLVPRLLRDVPAGREVHVARPDDRRDLVYVGDIVHGLVRLSRGFCGTVNLGTGRACTMREVAQIVLRLTGADEHLIRLGPPVAAPVELRVDPELAARRIGWTARIALKEGLERCLRALHPIAHVKGEVLT